MGTLEQSCFTEYADIVATPLNSLLRFPGRLRIGYVASDLKQHFVVSYFKPLLIAHNRKHFEIHCYSNMLEPNKITACLKEYIEYWHDISHLSDYETAEMIRTDQIDILIDLAAHTADSRLGLFDRRAAPVQLAWHTLSSLVDSVRCTDSLEDAYRTAWRTYSHAHPVSLPDRDDLFLQARKHFMQGEYNQARTVYEEILLENPDNPRALNGLGVVCHKLADSESAIRYISRAVQLTPGYPVALTSLGNVYKETGRVGEAIACFRQALAQDPGFVEIHSNILMNMQYLSEYSRDEIFLESRCWAEYHERRPFHEHLNEVVAVNTSGKIRIGFVSADFRKHPVGFIIIPFLTGYDRKRFELVCYSNSSEFDEVTGQIISLVDVWRVIDGVSDRSAWQMMHDDAIDILVDLSGHTAGNRLVLFSMRPAPMQVSWLGYFDTTGLGSIDYLITDRFIAPPGEDHWFSEKLVYLPDSRFCYAPPEYAPAIADPPVLTNGFVTFGSFNNVAKLTDEVIVVWAEILLRVKGARLIIKWKRCCDTALVANYQELFRKYGVDPCERVEFRGESGHQEVLRQYGDMDIALDPFPFSGGLTSLEALWMGVPIITLNGCRPVSRQTASFLEILKHGELVANSVEQYCDCAVRLAGNTEKLSAVRSRLRKEMYQSPLCHASEFAQNMSDLFDRIICHHNSLIESVAVFSQEQEGELDRRCNEAARLVESGNLDKAEACYEAILSDFKGYPRALHALGVVRYRRGNAENGIRLVKDALVIKPDYVDALLNLGKMLHEQKYFTEASGCYQRVADIRPDDKNSMFLLALLLSKAGKSEQAIIAYRRLITINPDNFDAIFNLGRLLLEARRLEEAEESLQHARSLAPDNVGVLIYLGNLALIRREYSNAENYYLAACAIDPKSAEAHTNLGHLFTELKQIKQAIKYCKLAVMLKPDFALGYANLGCVLVKSGQIKDAFKAYKNAVTFDPDFHKAHSNLAMLMHYLPDTTPDDAFQMCRDWDCMYAECFKSLWNKNCHGASDKKLKIGFVSPDFRRHPVAYFTLSFLKFHNSDEFEVFCYSDVVVEDDLTQTLRNQADVWQVVHTFDDAALNEIIRDDGIDILVDLAGHTAGNRLRVFAMKPAPIQVTWAGYVGTTGLSAIDYLISDRFQSAPGAELHTCEHIIRMPDDYISYSAPEFAPEVSPLPALSNGYVTFGVFNNLTKVTTGAIALWAEILKRVEGAHIFFKNPSFDDPFVVERYLKLFESHGISREKIRTEGQSTPVEMLDRYSFIDIQLDTFPYSGGLTTLESLWMGVPVVTLPGELFSSRHSLTHLMNAGLDEYVASTRDGYVAIACFLAGDMVKLAEQRSSLRNRISSSPICDGKLFANNLQQVFRWMWRNGTENAFDIPLVFEGEVEPAGLQKERNFVPVSDTNEFAKGLLCLQQKDFLGAAEFFERVVAAEPDNADAHNNLGIAYFEIGFRDDAKDEFKVATKLFSDHAEAWKNLGKALRDTGGDSEAAARCFRKALRIHPDSDDLWMMLGTTLLDRGRSAESVKCFRRSLELDAANCDAHSNLLFALSYIPDFSQSDMFAESLIWNENHTAGIVQRQHGVRHERAKSKKLRIGYVSGDFKRHPVGYHLLPVLAEYDRDYFEVYCYATMSEQDDLTEQMQGHINGWRDISRLSDDNAATLICDDQIDLLVDLAGHTKGSRLQLFARKPAPVQVSWLGYFNTTGVKAIDYLISDETTIPLGEEQWFSERIIRLPGSRFCYAPPEYAPSVVEPPVLKREFITFGSFNNIAKLTTEVIELWSMVLIALPDSRLIIKWSTLGRKKERDRLLQRFARHGIESDRLLLRGKSPHADMLKEYGDVDIALDPFPFTGGLTSCEALWMGVPVLTLLGDKPAGRQTAGFLRTIGLPEWVTFTQEQFVSRAKEVASDYQALKLLRIGLRERMRASTLCDGVNFTKNLEELFCHIWEEQSCLRQGGDDAGIGESPSEMSDPFITAALHYNDGIDQMESGEVVEAIRLFELAVLKNPDFALAYNNLGILKMQIDKVDEAEQSFRNALSGDASYTEAHYNLGLLYEKTKRFHKAIECFNAAIVQNSEFGEAYLEKGNVFLSLGELFQALECYEKAALLLPESAVVSNNIGMVFLKLEDRQQAELFLSEALFYDPEYAPPYINLSTLFRDMGRVSEAERVALSGLDRFPHDIRLLSVLSWTLIAQCRIFEALQYLRMALELKPQDAELHSNLLFALQYSEDVSLKALLSEHQIWSERHVNSEVHSRQFSNDRNPVRKLVVGYISPDFGRHPVGYFLMPVLSAHNREEYQVICYSDGKKTDDQTLMLESNADLWRDTSSCSDQELLELVLNDCVDILVDLAGHTVGNRLPLFAMKASPIQVTWAGYVGTTGLATMDYLISDGNESPPYADDITTEKIVRLPYGYVCYEPPDYAPEIMPLPALSNGYITFGCFNNLAKVNENVVKLWSELLKRLPGSRILLKTKSFNDQETRERYHQLFNRCGIETERVILEGDSRHKDLLAAYNRVDIALDPFPYSGGLTTLESLWMGVPVVTLGGDRFCSRHSLSHLTVLGLKETIARDAESYLSITLNLANDFGNLASLRSNLRCRMAASPLCDGGKFTSKLESVFRSMWQKWLSKCGVPIQEEIICL